VTILAKGNESTLLAEGFVCSFEVCAVDIANKRYCFVNELVKEPTRLCESFSFLTDLDSEVVDIESI